MTQPKHITTLLEEVSDGNRDAESELVLATIRHLKRLARHYMARERPDHDFQDSDLLQECYVQLLRVARQGDMKWQSEDHFYMVAARMMRRILVDYARKHYANKRGRSTETISLEKAFAYSYEESWDISALHEALDRLKKLEERQSMILELSHFTGLDRYEIAQALQISPTTVKRELRLARAWLSRELSNASHRDA